MGTRFQDLLMPWHRSSSLDRPVAAALFQDLLSPWTIPGIAWSKAWKPCGKAIVFLGNPGKSTDDGFSWAFMGFPHLNVDRRVCVDGIS